ncbi:hypothetical protein O3P69_012659 [Scylla paramamosain]|uniref:Uncharacterized protein n=1 Tax=Scylla paramamosain TaxID=85552 RepID=A0AAW0SIN9_SCYPA
MTARVNCLDCDRVVADHHQAIDCDGCGGWQHRGCGNTAARPNHNTLIRTLNRARASCQPKDPSDLSFELDLGYLEETIPEDNKCWNYAKSPLEKVRISQDIEVRKSQKKGRISLVRISHGPNKPIPGVELRQVEGKWRNLKSIFHNYEDYKRSSGKGKKTEPRFYNLLYSILKNRPLSWPDLCVLEGTEVGTRSVAEMEVDNPVEEDPATQASSVLNIPATPASLLDPQHGEASQCAATPPQASPPDPQPARAPQAPQPAPATHLYRCTSLYFPPSEIPPGGNLAQDKSPPGENLTQDSIPPFWPIFPPPPYTYTTTRSSIIREDPGSMK